MLKKSTKQQSWGTLFISLKYHFMETFHKDLKFLRGIPRPECFSPSLSHDPFKNISGLKIFTVNLYKSNFFFLSFSLCFKFHQCLRVFVKYLSLYPTTTVHWMVHQLSTYFKDPYSSWQILAALFSKHSLQILLSV